MALVIKDRVKETTTTTGTGTFNLAGAVSGFEGFIQVGDGNTTYYVCTDNTDFEIGIGTFTDASPDTLSRDTILQSSNSDNKVDWSAGTRTIFCTYPADKAVFEDASNNINGTFVGNITGDVTGNADTATTLENAREINGTSFNGSANITVTAAAGTLTGNTLNSTVTASSLTSLGTLASNLNLGGQDIVTTTSNQDIDLAAHGTGKVVVKGNTNQGAIKLNCEANSHGQTIIAAPHSESANNTLTLPSTGGDARLVSTSSTATLTNKTLTTPTINGATLGSGNLATSSNGDINFAPNGTGKIVVRGNTNQGKIVLNCESNSHGQTIIAAPHSESANNVLTLPSTGGDARLVSTASTATLTNKTIDSDNNTITNIVNADIKSSAAIANSKLANSTITVSDGSNTTAVALGGTVTFAGTSNEVEVAESSGTVTIGLPNNVTIAGNLTVNGTTTTIDTTNTLVKDSLLGLNNGASSNSNDSGIIIERGSTGNDALFIWDESEDKFALGTTTDNASSTGNLNMTTGTLVANIEGNVTGNVTGNVSGSSGSTTGNAATATALATGRTIGMTGDVVWTSASFDGSGNVTGSATIQSSAVETSMINADAVTGAKIANDAIDSEHYTDGSIDTAHIADDQVTQAKIADDAVGAAQLASNAVVNASVASGAAIAFSKMESLTASRALVSDGSGDLVVSAVTSTEIGHLDGVTSAIQTQLDAKASKGFATAMAIAL